MDQRNLLVIASQCSDPALWLDNLTETAHELARAFLDPRSGDCRPGLRSGEAVALNMSHIRVPALVREAIELAGEQNAVLVVAFLGHGMVFDDGSLRFMAVDSTDALDSIGLAGMAAKVARDLRPTGAIFIADVCMAGKIASHFDLSGSEKRRLALLMAGGKRQEAYGLAFSRALTKVLDEGVADAPPTLSATAVKRAILDLREQGLFPELDQQDPVVVDADGATSGPPLWITRNVSAEAPQLVRSRGTISELLERRLSGIQGPQFQIPELSLRGLSDLRDQLRSARQNRRSPNGDMRQTGLIARALEDTEDIIFAVSAASFVREWVASGLTVPRIRKGAAMSGACLPERFDGTLEEAFIHVAISPESDGGPARVRVARYVSWIGIEAGRSLDDAELQRWARTNQCTEYVNEVRDRLSKDGKALRLIVSLHDSMGDEWPDELVAWVLRGPDVLKPLRKPCSARSETATEDALRCLIDEALRFAESIGEDDENGVRRIELVAPADILLRWRFEGLTYGVALTNIFEVVARWSGRMASSSEMRRMRYVVKKRLLGIEDAEMKASGITIDWFGRHLTEDGSSLDTILAKETIRIVGVDHPIASPDLFTRIVKHTPGLVWPTEDRDISLSERLAVEKCWYQMPGSPSIRQRGGKQSGGLPLLKVRMIWDDRQWLEFCDKFPSLGLTMTEENS